MRYRRTVYAIIIAAMFCVSFSGGFLVGRRTAGGTYTISAEQTVFREENAKYDILTGEASIEVSCSDKPGENIDIDSLYLNINTCNSEQLKLLPSIGETRASSIIEYREKNGPFKSIADIMQVSGIGESVYDKIKQFIYVDIYK